MKSKSPRAARSKPDRSSETSPPARGTQNGNDVVLIHGVSDDGAMAVLRARNDRVEAGIMRSVKAGEPVSGELLKLKPRPECPLVCDVEVAVPDGTINAAGGSDQPRRVSHGGPAQVATRSYRDNWDAIWSKPRASKKALPN